MSQMPDSIYLHKDSKYNTSGEYFAQDENRILYENEYDESVMEDYVEYTPIYRLEEAVRKVEKDLADAAAFSSGPDGFYYGKGYQQGKKDAEKHFGWHSVEESLPPIDEEVIVLTDELNTAPIYKIAFGHLVDTERYIDYNGWNIPGVKFWMPMPKIPNEE